MRIFYILFFFVLLFFSLSIPAFSKEQFHIYDVKKKLLEYSDTNLLFSQHNVYENYQNLREKNLLHSKEGFSVLGDLAVLNKKYNIAAENFFLALNANPKNLLVKNKLAYSYRMLGYLNGAEILYKEILEDDSENIFANLGLGFVQLDRKNFDKSKKIFSDILVEKPDFLPAKIGLISAFTSNNERLSALELLDSIPEENQSELMKAQIYFDFNMSSSANEILQNTEGKESETLKLSVKKNDAITLTPTYSFFWQNLADEFHLNYQKYGFSVSKNIQNNSNFSMEYNVIWYSSSSPDYFFNVVNEFKGGIQARPNKKWEYKANIGVKSFQSGNGAMITTDSWIKHYFNDYFNLKFGVKRDNVEQSYLAAVGKTINGIFTGRVADTEIYFEHEEKLPKEYYSYGKVAAGFYYGQNLPTNPYCEVILGLKKIFYYNPENYIFQKFAANLMTDCSTNQYDLLYIYNKENKRFGGYFSPVFFNATTLNLKIEGEIKKLKLKYGIIGFGGIQTSISNDTTIPAWGVFPYISFDINKNISINASYNHYNYADVQRDLFIINAVIKLFDFNKLNGK